jgi:hypothetical protein
MLIMLQHKKLGPMPAVGIHAELLADMEATATGLIALIGRERTGIYDGLGGGFRVGSDSVLNAAKRLVALAEQRAGELRDAGPRG